MSPEMIAILAGVALCGSCILALMFVMGALVLAGRADDIMEKQHEQRTKQ